MDGWMDVDVATDKSSDVSVRTPRQNIRRDRLQHVRYVHDAMKEETKKRRCWVLCWFFSKWNGGRRLFSRYMKGEYVVTVLKIRSEFWSERCTQYCIS